MSILLRNPGDGSDPYQEEEMCSNRRGFYSYSGKFACVFLIYVKSMISFISTLLRSSKGIASCRGSELAAGTTARFALESEAGFVISDIPHIGATLAGDSVMTAAPPMLSSAGMVNLPVVNPMVGTEAREIEVLMDSLAKEKAILQQKLEKLDEKYRSASLQKKSIELDVKDLERCLDRLHQQLNSTVTRRSPSDREKKPIEIDEVNDKITAAKKKILACQGPIDAYKRVRKSYDDVKQKFDTLFALRFPKQERTSKINMSVSAVAVIMTERDSILAIS